MEPGQAPAPRLLSISPANGNFEVDHKSVVELVVVFDRDMQTTGYSFAGGGPSFPKLPKDAMPRWSDKRTCVLPVELEANHMYSLFLNGGRNKGFRSTQGVPLVPVPWSFATLPDPLPDPIEQRARNTAALDELNALLDERYSYRDRVVKDWPALRKTHRSALHSAKTDLGWAAAAGRMLEATEDLHLHLKVGQHRISTGSRSVDSLYRAPLLSASFESLKPVGQQALVGRTKDDIGYLMIATWTEQLDVDAVEEALEELKDARAVIIDVRPNGGGDELLARRIARHFVVGKRIYAKHRYRDPAAEGGFGRVHERQIDGLSRERVFDGPVVLLTSPMVMSSCEAFVLMIRQAQDCTVVGRPTEGSSGNPKDFELSNGVHVVIPSWQVLRLDESSFEGEGLAPDVLVDVQLEELQRRDPILERALEILRK